MAESQAHVPHALKKMGKKTSRSRARRAAELASEHPAHVAAAWPGHSTIVANKHYWQVTDAGFAKATEGSADAGEKNSAEKNAQRRAVGTR